VSSYPATGLIRFPTFANGLVARLFSGVLLFISTTKIFWLFSPAL
jgi:hypothetical protein